jgi:hypothetical protein
MSEKQNPGLKTARATIRKTYIGGFSSQVSNKQALPRPAPPLSSFTDGGTKRCERGSGQLDVEVFICECLCRIIFGRGRHAPSR